MRIHIGEDRREGRWILWTDATTPQLLFSYFFTLTYSPDLQSRPFIVVPSYAQSRLRIGHESGIESGTERLNDESVKEETHQRPVAQSSPLIRPKLICLDVYSHVDPQVYRSRRR